eukprot:scaffold284914_cov32-Tisochrysis_lutea.AAC.2
MSKSSDRSPSKRRRWRGTSSCMGPESRISCCKPLPLGSTGNGGKRSSMGHAYGDSRPRAEPSGKDVDNHTMRPRAQLCILVEERSSPS